MAAELDVAYGAVGLWESCARPLPGPVPRLLSLYEQDLYPDPDQFSPERFLGRAYGPFEYLPFGGGSRRCLGASFAVYEMKLVLATVLRAHALQLTDRGDVRSALRNTTASPAKKIRAIRLH